MVSCSCDRLISILGLLKERGLLVIAERVYLKVFISKRCIFFMNQFKSKSDLIVTVKAAANVINGKVPNGKNANFASDFRPAITVDWK